MVIGESKTHVYKGTVELYLSPSLMLCTKYIIGIEDLKAGCLQSYSIVGAEFRIHVVYKTTV